MYTVALIHWKDTEVLERLERLKTAGFAPLSLIGADGLATIQSIRINPPDAIVIDLSRLPSHGRETALALRQAKATREIPLIFADGEAEKVEKIRAVLPDATYTSWRTIAKAVDKAIRTAPAEPKAPDLSRGYSGTPLPKKLGITDDSTFLILNGPGGFAESLKLDGRGVTIKTQARGSAPLVILFVKSTQDLTARLPAAIKCLANPGALWLAWPKKTSGVATDLNENVIREVGLASGLVDTKVCAIDATWSGLRFNRRVVR